MRGFKNRIVLKLVTVFVLFALVGCAINPVTGKKELMLLSEADEIEMGNNLYPNAIWGAQGGGGAYQDQKLETYLNSIITRIHETSHRPNLPVSFEIQNSSLPNAWAIPGYVVITRGLLAALDDEAEFAFIMGHEMGHISARHSARQMTKGIMLNLGLALAGIALQDKEETGILLGVGAIGGTLLILKYSRDDELEADRLGTLYMAKLGYDPLYATRAHRNLENVSNEYLRSLGEEPRERSFFEDLLSTHPGTEERIEQIEELINTSPPLSTIPEETNQALFQSMITGIKKTNRVYIEYYDRAVRAYQKDNLKEAIYFLNKAITEDRFQPPFYALTGFVYLKQKNYIEAERYFNGALTLDRDYQPACRGVGILNYRGQKYSESISDLEKSISLFPDDVLSRYYLGMSYYRIKAYETAIPYLEKVAEARTEHPTLHGTLGICYEATQDVASAYQHFLKQLEIAADNEMGEYATSRVTTLKPIIEGSQKKK